MAVISGRGKKLSDKELILAALEVGSLTRREIVLDCIKHGATEGSLERRITELCREGKIVVSDDRPRLYSLQRGDPIYDSAAAVKLDQQVVSLRTDRDKLSRLYRDALKYKQLTEVLVDAYADHCVRWQPVPVPNYVPPESSISEEVAIAVLSDWHFWETTDLQETGGLAEYNMDIAAGYMQHLVDKTVRIFKQVHSSIAYRKCYVLLVGDFVSTNIHEVLQHSPGTAVDSLLEGQYVLGRYLMDLAQVFDEVHVKGVVGNHGRLQQKKTYTKRYANWDYVLYNQLAMMLANQANITFDFPKSFFQIVEIEGHKILLLHGDDIRSWNQVPWYGLDRAIRRFRELLLAHGKDFGYVILGHFHNTGALEMCRGEKLINGSAIGISNFSLGRLFTGNLPHQTIISCHQEHGLTWRQPVQLQMPDDLRYTIDRGQQIHTEWQHVLGHRIKPDADPLVNDSYNWQQKYVE